MSWRADLAANLRRIILMDDKLERLGAEVAALRRETTALDRRVVRIETLIEMAGRARPPAPRDPGLTRSGPPSPPQPEASTS